MREWHVAFGSLSFFLELAETAAAGDAESFTAHRSSSISLWLCGSGIVRVPVVKFGINGVENLNS